MGVLEEIRKLENHGFKEIILSGIHTASYGVDLNENISLISLLEEIEKIDGIERVRIGSIEPSFFTEEVIEKMSNMKKICPQFHLSLQSGCDETLKRMNRRYTTTVSYTHLTLPTILLVQISVVAVSLKKKKKRQTQRDREYQKNIVIKIQQVTNTYVKQTT
eukprot:TRINITY_DN68251_c0_g1_i1.p2 TRINITY_DN68251_c0_g1~~TRINITY_DN68251_c0_g1_i1.p2  ORF type:complete len:162 (-),score=32.66 TRINITY_DN68251_c0_g1_i1:15-500(-)